MRALFFYPAQHTTAAKRMASKGIKSFPHNLWITLWITQDLTSYTLDNIRL